MQDSISSKVSQTDFNALGTIVETAESNITQNANNIALKVSQTDFNALGGRVGTAESTITQHSTAIASKVSQTTFNALGTRVSTAESTITQHATDIDLRVTKDGVIGAINLTSEAATIKASKINLNGAVTFSSFDSSTKATINGKADSAAHGNFTYIDGSSVYTGTLTANQVNAVAISASSITTGTLAAERIAANSITGDKIVGNSITGDKIVVNSITGDKLVMKTITALGNVIAGSFNIGSGKFVVDANGNMTAVDANLSGVFSSANAHTGNSIVIDAVSTDDVFVCTGPSNVQDENPDLPQDATRKALFKVHFDTDIDSLTRYAMVSISDGREDQYSNEIILDSYNGVHLRNQLGDSVTITTNGIIYSTGSVVHSKSWLEILS